MAIVLTGNSGVFDALVFGQGNRTGQAYIDSLNQQFVQNVTAPVLENYNYLMQTSMFQTFRQDALDYLHAMNVANSMVMQPNSIFQLNDLGQFQHATTTMQRWIMANPEIRNMYHRQEIDGYSDTYVDRSNGKSGEDDYDYRRVTNGITMDHGTGEFENIVWTEELLNDNDELTFLEQTSVYRSWLNALYYIEQKFDPTSPYNDRLP